MKFLEYIKNFISRMKSAYNDLFEEVFLGYYGYEYDELDNMVFIWGVPSPDSISANEPNIHTLNDLELIYHKDIQKYTLNVETLYLFKNREARYEYMQGLLDEFTQWMHRYKRSTNREISLCKVFTNGININSEFETIEDAYATFKMFVNGYCSLKS